MGINVTAGAKVYIGTTTAAATLPAYEGDTYTEVKQVEDIGEFGDEANPVEVLTIGDARTRRIKGSQDGGQLALICLRDASDAGQTAMIAASKVRAEYNFKCAASDAPAGGTPTIFYMRAVVLSAKLNFSGADDLTRITFNIAINSEILEDEAAEA